MNSYTVTYMSGVGDTSSLSVVASRFIFTENGFILFIGENDDSVMAVPMSLNPIVAVTQ